MRQNSTQAVGILGATLYALRSLLRLIWRPTNVPAALALFVIVLAGLFAEYQNRRVTSRACAPTCSAGQPDPRQARGRYQRQHPAGARPGRDAVDRAGDEAGRFAQLAANLLAEKSQLRNIAGAPDLVISLMYPLKGNERAIGLDYRKNDAQREAAFAPAIPAS